MRLKDKVAIITGASKGLGAEIAKMFAKEGATIVGVARSIDRLEKLKKQIEADGGKALVLKVDVRNREDIKKMAEETYKNFGRIDILVNNAGYLLYSYPIDDPREEAEERFHKVIDTNWNRYWRSATFVAGSDLVVGGVLACILAEEAALNIIVLHGLYEKPKEKREWLESLQ